MAFNAGDIEATMTLDRSPFNEGLLKARVDAEKFEKRGIKVKVDIDKSAIGQLQKAIDDTAKSGKPIKLPVDVDKKTIDDVKSKIDDIADNTELTAKRSGNRVARGLLNPLVIQLGLLPGIAMAAAAAGGLALGALPLVFGAIGAMALKSNTEIKDTYSELWQSIKSEAAGIAEPLVGTFTTVSENIFGAWRQIRPELAQIFKDIDPLIDDLSEGVLGLATEAVPKFQQAIAVSGPTVRGLESLLKSVGSGLGDMVVNASANSLDLGRSIEITGDMIERLLGFVGDLVSQFGSFWADVGPKFERVFDKMLDSVTLFVDGGLTGLGTGLNVLLTIIETFLNVVGPFADVFGQVGGYAIAAVAAFKLLSGAVGLVGKAWEVLSPAETAGRLGKVSQAVTTMSTRFGEYTAIALNSAVAGDRAETAIRKIGNAVIKTVSWLPLLGTALAAGQAVIDHFWPSADELANQIQRGGAAAAEAKDKIYDVGQGYNQGSMWAQTFAATGGEVKDALDKQRSSMTEVERAQQDATRAQNDYQYAIDQFGENSPQARRAQLDLASATDYLAVMQEKAKRSTEDHTDAVIRQTNEMLAAVGSRLGYQSSLISLEKAQREWTDAVTEHGVGSLEARDADIQYQQSILSVINALGARVTAENASKGETEAARLATAAMHQEIARLAVAAGTDLPPALAEMAAGLTDAELKALGVTKEIDSTGNAIYRLPPGKSLDFPSNAPVATSQIQGLASAIDNVKPSKWITFYVNYITKGNPPPNTSGPAGSGGLLGPLVGSEPPRRATGGPVRAGQPYWVGDAGLPELFFPDENGFVLNGKDSAKFGDKARMGGSSAAPFPVPQGGDGSSSPDPEQLAQMFAAALAQVLDGVRLVVDGDGVAKLVNQVNQRNGAR
jgi:hypothetical protein